MLRLKRREVVGGKSRPDELILAKFRKEPFSVYLKWLGEEGKGQAAEARAALRTKAERTDTITDGTPILSVEDLCVDYMTGGWLPGSTGHRFRAVDKVSFAVRSGEVFGLVGESGCGKTTIANVVSGLVRPTSGRVVYRDTVVAGAEAVRRAGPLRQAIQMIFQDPYSSLNGRLRIGSILPPIGKKDPTKPKGFPRGRFTKPPVKEDELKKLKPKKYDDGKFAKPKLKPTQEKDLPPEEDRRPDKFTKF